MQTLPNKMVRVLPEFYILIAASLLILPLQWVLAWFAASAVHELCHYVTLRICGIRIYSVKLGVSGTIMETEEIRPRYEAVSAMAGPLGGLVLLVFLRHIPHIAICAVLQSAFNLLPIYPLDGGRVFRCCITHWFCNSTAEKICYHTENWVLFCLLIISCFLSFYYRLGFLPLAVFLLILLKCRKIKTPCKQTKQIVQ